MRLIGIVNASKLAHYVLNGNGVGEPLGILNSAALYQQIHASATALAKGDVTAMISRFQTFGDGLFVAHRSNLPDIHAIIMDSEAIAGFVAEVAGGRAMDNVEAEFEGGSDAPSAELSWRPKAAAKT